MWILKTIVIRRSEADKILSNFVNVWLRQTFFYSFGYNNAQFSELKLPTLNKNLIHQNMYGCTDKILVLNVLKNFISYIMWQTVHIILRNLHIEVFSKNNKAKLANE